MSRRVIIVTDADCKATEAVEVATRNIGGRTISISGCRHPDDARFTPEEIEELVVSAEHDPVVVMVDDEGVVGEGMGEAVIRHLAQAPGVELLGVVAVASNTEGARPVPVAASVTRTGQVVGTAVDKDGYDKGAAQGLRGDTTEVLAELGITNVIGIGDPGKMGAADSPHSGAKITEQALREVIKRSGTQIGPGQP